MKVFFFLMLIFCCAVYGRAQFKNNKIAEDGLQTAVAINHKNPGNIIIAPGANVVVYSVDGGNSWKETKLGYGVPGNALLLSSSNGTVNFFHIPIDGQGRNVQQIVYQSSLDGGKTWTPGVSIGSNPSKDQDKPGVGINPKKGTLCIAWTQFDKYGSSDSTCQSNILFSQSSSGKRWGDPVQINQIPGDCADGDDTVVGAIPLMDSEKKIFLIWSRHETIFFDRSYNAGDTWLTTDLAIVKQVGKWSLKIPGIDRCNRLPVIAIDNSQSFFKNSLYMVWADQRNGENDTDIWFLRSTNRGDYWGAPFRINKDLPGKHQFMPWMAVDPSSGVIYIVYYDRRNYNDLQTDVYLAYSTDGGDKFTEQKISEKPFVPSAEKPFASTISITADHGIIVPVWIRMEDGKTSVWTTIIKQNDIIKPDNMPRLQNGQRYKGRRSESPGNTGASKVKNKP